MQVLYKYVSGSAILVATSLKNLAEILLGLTICEYQDAAIYATQCQIDVT